MLDQRIKKATEAVKAALPDTVPPSIEELVDRSDRAVAPPGVGWRGPLVAVGTAVAVLLVVGIAVLVVQANTADVADAPTPASTRLNTATTAVPSELGRVFAWDGDDLTEWVTEEEMTAALRDVLSRYADTDLDGEAQFDRDAAEEGQWDMGGWRVRFRNVGDRYLPYYLLLTDSRLPRGVTFQRGWGEYIFLAPNTDETIAINLLPPDWILRRRHFAYPVGPEIPGQKAVLFPLVSWMLQEMGWVDPSEAEAAPAVPTTEPSRVPIMGTEQILYATDYPPACGEHLARDLSLPVGTVEFVAGQGMFTVVVELTGAAPNSDYEVEVLYPENCWDGFAFLFFAPTPARVLSTDENGAGRLEFTVDDVEPRTYRVNVGVVIEGGLHEPDGDDIRAGYTPLWTIGGAGFSLVEIP